MGAIFTFVMYFSPVFLLLALLAVVLMLMGYNTVALWISYGLLGYILALVATGVVILVGGIIMLALKPTKYN